ncbi:coiled-coil domain-containing protein 103 [Drosophila biarmipes]|uniref:coiled-coil domain-containing protein 103 n=1 Tax=Drosophila biarmipes TaxID=125945 RepID=UPI0007E66641|nr:coiled-coil domain-containing protein 103 [Drosophila biarmipes]
MKPLHVPDWVVKPSQLPRQSSQTNSFIQKTSKTIFNIRKQNGGLNDDVGGAHPCIRDGELYELRNDAKLRAVYSTQTYEEFKDIVDAAHLRPVSRSDKANAKTKNRLWNSAARD